MTTRRDFLRACIAGSGMVLIPKLVDRYRWVATPSGIVRPDYANEDEDHYGFTNDIRPLILNVPGDYPTVQAALDASRGNWTTAGRYLHIRCHGFSPSPAWQTQPLSTPIRVTLS